jgi:hypothetical protein
MRTKLLILAMITFCSCGQNGTDNTINPDPVIEIDLLSEPESEIAGLSDIAENIEYIPLQTTENSLIGAFTLKILNVGNRIYIQNGGMTGEILCFDITGKFLFKISNEGRGPEEYDFITDFDVSSDNKILTILSGSSRKLVSYGISDTGFTFLRSITLKEPAPWRVSLIPETDLAFLSIPSWQGTEQALSLLINSSGDTILSRPNRYKFDRVQTGRPGTRSSEGKLLTYSIGDLVCFKEDFSDTVFYVDARNRSFRPRIIFNTHGTSYTPEMKGGSEKIKDNSTTYIPKIFETSRYVFCQYYTIIVEQKVVNLYGFFFDKKTNSKYKSDIGADRKMKLSDDLSGGPDFRLEYQENRCSNGRLFSYVESITLKQYVDSDDFKDANVMDPNKKSELKRLADSLEETDNPVLVVVTPKE